MNKRLIPGSLLLLATACSTSPEPQAELAVNQTSVQNGSVTQTMPDGADPSEWSQARGSILRTFAFRALEKGLVEQAREYLTEACEVDMTDTASHAALARLYLAEGNSVLALTYAERASLVAPDDPEINMVFAAALAENNRLDEATATLEKTWVTLERDPQFARAILTHYSAMGQTGEAKEFVHRMLTEDPTHASSWSISGDMMLAVGDLEGATEAYRKALEIDPNLPTPESIQLKLGGSTSNQDPMYAAALAAEDQGQLEAAANLYRFLVESKPLNNEVRLGLSRVLWAQGRYELCDMQMVNVASGVRGWRGHLLQAKLDIRFERFGKAKTSLMLALRERPDLKSAELLLAYVDQHIAEELTDTSEDT
ncbi:MAG: tetratricopeptide repeat protein [Planctomycetota bacterium]|nr:tetratricopeptide repeat protein [Planctomycetota bacterium]